MQTSKKKKKEGSKKGGKKGRQNGRDKWGEWIAVLKTSKQEKIDTKPWYMKVCVKVGVKYLAYWKIK